MSSEMKVTTNVFDDPSTFRLGQAYTETVGVKKLLKTVPVRKPNRQEWVRVHPDAGYRLTPAAIYEDQHEREVFLLMPGMANELPGEYSAATLFTAVNRQGVLFIWPVKLPKPDGRLLGYYRSAAEAAESAMQQWIRIIWNPSLMAYDMYETTAVGLPEPEWPDVPFNEILGIAFRDRLVDRADHPLVQRLRGQI